MERFLSFVRTLLLASLFATNVFASEPIVIAINKGVPLGSFDKSTLKSLFSGEISNWKQLRGPNLKIDMVYLDAESLKVVLEKAIGLNRKDWVKGKELKTPELVVGEIEKNPTAIGFLGLKDFEKIGSKVAKAMKFEGVKATSTNALNGKYLLK